MLWQAMYIYVSSYLHNKLEHKYTLITLDPRLLYVGPIQSRGHLSFRETCPDSYNYLSVLCVLPLAACSDAGHLSIPCSVGQLPTHTMQYWAASNTYYLDYCMGYIVFVLFYYHVYQNCMVS